MDPLQPTTGGKSPADKVDSRQVTVTANIQLAEKKELQLALLVKNGAPRDIYLINRLWTLNEQNMRVADPEQIYRFVQKEDLRLMLGVCPMPRSTVTYRNVSELTLLPANKSFESQYVIPIPVLEYNVYFEKTNAENSRETQVSQIEVLVEFLAAGEAVKVKPSTFQDDALELVSPESLKDIQIARSEPKKLSLPAWLRTDEFARPVLPGEKPEPLPLK
jgi:hypothetical protein